jgi:UPF0716 protein FxsA
MSSKVISTATTIRMRVADASRVPEDGRVPVMLLLFIVLPATELALLIEIGRHVGVAPTLLLIVLTGMAGATLARWQGLGVLRAIQTETAAGRLPAAQLVDGLILLVASALLITPGILTDAAGFLCLVPAFRGFLRRTLRRRFERAVAEGRVVMVHWEDFGDPGGPRVHDVTPGRHEPPPPPRRLP